jgi:hypothetical protein
MNTRLPDGLSLGYCDGAMSAKPTPHPAHHPRHLKKAMLGLDRAIIDVETLLAVETDAPTRSRLQRVHRDLTQSREEIRR